MSGATEWKAGPEQLIVRRDTAPEQIGNLDLPEQARKAPPTAEIVSVGSPNPATPSQMDMFEVGQRVLIGRFGASEFEVAGENGQADRLAVVNIRDVRAVVPDGVQISEVA